MMRLVARNASNTVLATTDVVLRCRGNELPRCHSSNSGAAAGRGRLGERSGLETGLPLNVLRLHDEKFAGQTVYIGALAANGYNANGLYATVVQDGRPVLCAQCHSSEALGTPSYPGVPH